MDYQMFKIHNPDDFNRITKGIKVAQCMQSRTSYVTETEKVLNLVVSDSLCCSFCNAVFEDKTQQRHHYKLDWHCYNLKRHLKGLKSISESSFNSLVDEGTVSGLFDSDIETEDEDEAVTSENGSSVNDQTKNESTNKNDIVVSNEKLKKIERRRKIAESISDSSDTECNEEMLKKKKIQALMVIAIRHSKVFFENEQGNIFSIYRCLLYHKKDIPKLDHEMIAQALNSGKRTMWTIVMVGGGHFAAAVFQNGEPIVHKTFHSYTVRAKQGFAQNSRLTGNHAKSAGASLRKYNEASFIQHVQEILELWSTHINDSSLILYRAVGPYNRTVLFGGKTPALDKNDSRLRPLPFPTRRATFNEVKRVYDILSTMEIYGSAADFTDCFPSSPRQPMRKKVSKSEQMDEITEDVGSECNPNTGSTSSSQESDKIKPSTQSSPERQHRNPRSHIDRAKPRKSPNRPLPDIVARLAQSSSDSELDEKFNPANSLLDFPLIEQNLEIEFNEHLLAFQDTVPRYMKNKKIRRQKKKEKKDSQITNEVLLVAKVKLWAACKLGDNEMLSSALDDLLVEVKKCEELAEQNKSDVTNESNNASVTMIDVKKLVNDTNEDGNTMLHLAALGGHLKLVWLLLETGCDPCNKNKKLQTPYAAANDKETRNTFRRFMGANPDKFNYQKSQIPGPLNDEVEQEQAEKKKQQRKIKRLKEKIKRKEFEMKKQEEDEKQRFLSLSDREKRAFAAEKRMLSEGCTIILRCFQCAVDMTGQVPFEYNANRFCSMPCLKEHRLHNKFVI